MIKTTVPTSENEKVTVSLKYDERNKIRYVVLDDGTQIGLVYDYSGLWQGFSFPDGGKMLFKRNASGEIIGLRRVPKSASQQVHGTGTGRLLTDMPRRPKPVSETAPAGAAFTSLRR